MPSYDSRGRHGVSIRMFLADGTPEGLRLIEKSNWTGLGVMCSRAQYPEVRGRDEFSKPGVYLLFGPSADDSSRQAIYIGQADVARERLDQHVRGKDFWTHLILFSSKDTNLNKAHVQYLEARLIEIAVRARRATMENGNAPRLPSLSEADRADAEGFLTDMLLLYPVLGVSAFEVVEAVPDSERPKLRLTSRGTSATGEDTPEGFIVHRGAKGRSDTVASSHRYLLVQRQRLIETGVLVEEGDALILTQDWRFESPSTAAGVLMGRNANGRIDWKDEQGRTLKDLQEAAVGSSAAGSEAS